VLREAYVKLPSDRRAKHTSPQDVDFGPNLFHHVTISKAEHDYLVSPTPFVEASAYTTRSHTQRKDPNVYMPPHVQHFRASTNNFMIDSFRPNENTVRFSRPPRRHLKSHGMIPDLTRPTQECTFPRRAHQRDTANFARGRERCFYSRGRVAVRLPDPRDTVLPNEHTIEWKRSASCSNL
jgi:hypothetical protein